MEVLKKPIALDETLQEVVGQLNDLNNKILIAKGDSFEYEDFTPEQLEALKGDKGDKGDDGFSPIATVTKSGNKSTISITDADGTTTAEVLDGKDGKDGYTPIKGKDYFDGEKGDDYVITDADYEAIAERTKDLVPPYDDTEIRAELSRTDDRLDALWKINEGQTYDVLESASEDYAKVVPSGSKYASVDVVGGKSVVWNQMVKIPLVGESKSLYGVTITNNQDGTFSVSGTNSGSSSVTFNCGNTSVVAEHKYYLNGGNVGDAWNNMCIYVGDGASSTVDGNRIFTKHQTGISTINYAIWPGKTANNLVYKPRLFDITQMFGAGNEPTSVDDERIKHIEEYVLAHPEYNAGEIISSQTDEVVVRGKNLIDLSKCKSNKYVRDDNGNEYTLTGYNVLVTDFMPVESGVKYVFSGYYRQNSGNSGAMYDKDKNYVSSIRTDADANRIIPSGVAYVRLNLWGNYFNDITKAQYERGSVATNFAPYIEPTHIPTSLPPLNSAGSVYDYVDVDNGELHRRVGVVDLGTLNWVSMTYREQRLFYAGILAQRLNTMNYMCPKYTTRKSDISMLQDGEITGNGGAGSSIWMLDSRYENPTMLKASLNGVPLYYELAEETIEPITIPSDLTEWLECEANGTITFVNDQKLLVPNTERFIRKLNEVT